MKPRKTIDFVAAATVNIVALVVVNSWAMWRPWTHGVVLDTWGETLWAANLSIGVQIVGNSLLAGYHPPLLHALVRVAFAVTSLLSAIVFFIVFPIDFSHIDLAWMNSAAKVVLYVAMGGCVLAILVESVRFLRALVDVPRHAHASR